MLAFILLLSILTSLYMYGRWLGYFSLLTSGGKHQPFDVPRDWNYTPRVTFMIPSFNEGEMVRQSIESIMASDYPLDKIEILAVDDASSDDTWEWLQRMAAKFPANVFISRNNPNKGKPFTLVDCCRAATGEIVITVDSDTVIAPDAIRHLMSCYADPDIGGVGGQVRIKNMNASVWTQIQGVSYVSYFYLFKILENQAKASRCLCGPLASFRREVFLECAPLILERDFLGLKPIRASEDAYVTTIISLGLGLTRPWKLYNCFDALAWTENPTTLNLYLKQQLRWWRGTQLNGVMVLSNLIKAIAIAGVVPAVMCCFNTLIMINTLVFLLYLWWQGILINVVAYVVIWSAIMGVARNVIYNHLIGRHDPVGGRVKNVLWSGLMMGPWSLVMWIVLAIYGLWTMDDGGWITRAHGHSNVR